MSAYRTSWPREGSTLILKSNYSIITCLFFLLLLCQAYYRRASANMALGKFKLSLKDYEVVGAVDSKLIIHERHAAR